MTAISAELENNEMQTKSEKRARDAIADILKEKFSGQLIFDVFTIPTLTLVRKMEVIQPYLWLTQLPLRCDHKEIAIGYVSGDCFWHFKEFAKKTQEALNGFARDKFEFTFPMEWETKDDIATTYSRYEEIVPFLSVCESGNHWMSCTFDTCQKCPTMRRLWAKIMGMKLLEKESVQTVKSIYNREAPTLFDKEDNSVDNRVGGDTVWTTCKAR